MSSVAGFLALIVTLLLVVALYIFVLPDAKRPTLNKVFQKVHDFLKIKKLLTEAIFRFFYVYTVVACVVGGLFILFDNFWLGLGLIILGPVGCRIIFELLLMGVVLVKNVMEINNHLKGIDAPQEENNFNISMENVISNVGKKIHDITIAKETAEPKEPAEPKSFEKTCPKCGKEIPEGTAFCIHCGAKIEE